AHDRAGQAIAWHKSNFTVAFNPGTVFFGAEAIRSRRHIQSSAGIGYQAEARRTFHPKCEIEQFGREMLAISNHFGGHFGVSENELLHAGLHRRTEPGTQGRNRAHGAPKMVHMANASAEGSGHFRPAGIGVPAGNQAAMLLGRVVEGFRAGKFRRAGGNPNDAEREEAAILFGKRIAPSLRRMAPYLAFGKVRPVKMDAADTWAVSGRPVIAHMEAGADHALQLFG